ncbi:hypothetical protein NEOKW01_0033 [Nematocida sp. AWRm80]|nr:hypothetical protein NEOKW01_0033 [Nematocida sp. AWRm80]
MEKYSDFNDPTTGVNPYIRPIKAEYLLRKPLVYITLIRMVFWFPLLIYRVVMNRLVTVTPSKDLPVKLRLGKRVFACTYSSIFDVHVLNMIFKDPKIFLVTETNVYRVTRYNILIDSSDKEIEEEKKNKKIVILFLGGGLTNNDLLLDTEEDGYKYQVDSFIMIRHNEESIQDINLFERRVLPQFSSYLDSLVYYAFYLQYAKETPTASIFISDTLKGLSMKSKTEIAQGMDKKVTRSFLEMFHLEK